jgi:hypothetical protein
MMIQTFVDTSLPGHLELVKFKKLIHGG